jgi:hypothetical protein
MFLSNKYNESSYPFVFLQVLFTLVVPQNGPYKQRIVKLDDVFLEVLFSHFKCYNWKLCNCKLLLLLFVICAEHG